MTDPADTDAQGADPSPSLSDILRDPARQRELSQVVEYLANNRATYLTDSRSPGYRQQVFDRFQRFNQRHVFAVGDFVVWKEGLKNRTLPAVGQPVIIAALLDEPLLARPDDSGSAYFREPLDMIVGLIDEEGDLLFYHLDSRRFEPAPKST